MNEKVSSKIKMDENKYGYRHLFNLTIKNTNIVDKLILIIGLLSCLISSGLYPTAVWLYGKIVNLIVNYAIASRNSTK